MLRAPAPRVPGERNNVRGQATRLRILTAAEQLFAENGISAVPLRDIGKAAGQRNHAAVQYHFGDREEVIRAIMDYRGGESEERRAEIMAGFMMGQTQPTVSDVVGAFVRPLAIHFEPENHYLPFLSLFLAEEGGYESLEGGVQTGAHVTTLRALLGKLVPDVPQQVLDERWWVTLTSAVHSLARYHTARRKREHIPASFEVLVDDLIEYLSAGLTAPLAKRDTRK